MTLALAPEHDVALAPALALDVAAAAAVAAGLITASWKGGSPIDNEES